MSFNKKIKVYERYIKRFLDLPEESWIVLVEALKFAGFEKNENIDERTFKCDKIPAFKKAINDKFDIPDDIIKIYVDGLTKAKFDQCEKSKLYKTFLKYASTQDWNEYENLITYNSYQYLVNSDKDVIRLIVGLLGYDSMYDLYFKSHSLYEQKGENMNELEIKQVCIDVYKQIRSEITVHEYLNKLESDDSSSDSD